MERDDIDYVSAAAAAEEKQRRRDFGIELLTYGAVGITSSGVLGTLVGSARARARNMAPLIARAYTRNASGLAVLGGTAYFAVFSIQLTSDLPARVRARWNALRSSDTELSPTPPPSSSLSSSSSSSVSTTPLLFDPAMSLEPHVVSGACSGFLTGGMIAGLRGGFLGAALLTPLAVVCYYALRLIRQGELETLKREVDAHRGTDGEARYASAYKHAYERLHGPMHGMDGSGGGDRAFSSNMVVPPETYGGDGRLVQQEAKYGGGDARAGVKYVEDEPHFDDGGDGDAAAAANLNDPSKWTASGKKDFFALHESDDDGSVDTSFFAFNWLPVQVTGDGSVQGPKHDRDPPQLANEDSK
jgi:hypothetical protein